jgi:hypothetical protein
MQQKSKGVCNLCGKGASREAHELGQRVACLVRLVAVVVQALAGAHT